MSVDAKTIQIFLPTGEPRGLRIAEITTRIVQAIQIPRTQIDRFLERPEVERVALYFLFGTREEQAKPVVYIGQTEDLCARLKDHNQKKDFWQFAVAVQASNESFTLTHLKYLEWHAIRQAAEAKRYHFDNGNAGSKPHIPEALEADCMDAFETASILLSTLGFPVFDPVTDTSKRTYRCISGEARAEGRLVNDGFVVLKGSTAKPKVVPSAHGYVSNTRQTLQDSGILVEDGSVLRFTEDYLFQSPSGAAGVVLGANTNGWVAWKTSEGKTLEELERPKGTASEN